MKAYVFYILLQFYMIYVSTTPKRRYNIGVIFDNSSKSMFDNSSLELERALKYALELLNADRTTEVDITAQYITYGIDVTDSFEVSNALCEHMERGVYAFLGISRSCAMETMQSYVENFEIPFITLSMPQESKSPHPFQLFMRPYYIDGLLDVIQYYKWERMIYVYYKKAGLSRLQQLLQSLDMHAKKISNWNLDLDVKRADNITDCMRLLKEVYNRDDAESLRILLDIPIKDSEIIIEDLKEDGNYSNHRFHFLLGDLGFDGMDEEKVLAGGMNITGFQLINRTNVQNHKFFKEMSRKIGTSRVPINFETALIYDALKLLQGAFMNFSNTIFTHANRDRSSKCRHNQDFVKIIPGKEFMKHLKQINTSGLTGPLSFDRQGLRKGFNLSLLTSTMTMRVAEIGYFNLKKGLTTHDPHVKPKLSSNGAAPFSNRTRMVTTVLDKPYVMYKTPEIEKERPRCGKENFKGFCIDLAEKIAADLKFNYNICLVSDGKYGEKLSNGTWNGVIGELTKNQADLAIAAMTISSERERVVDFTKPYMSLGISIMIKKPSDKTTHVFSFMDPLSYEIWMCILFAYVGVSVVLFLVGRFSPTEWRVDKHSNMRNDFTISNSLWFSLGAFMQQGCDISPRALSGRIVGSVWWFFTLIIISSYTANLAAFLTVERMNTPIESAEDLAKQTSIQYGMLNAGTTKTFFKQSKVAIYERMWAYMTSANPSVFVNATEDGIERVRRENGKYAFLIESTTNEYTNMKIPCDTMKVGTNLDSKGYGIATPVGSDLREYLTLTILQFRESGDLETLKKKWWDDQSECPPPGTGNEMGQSALTLDNVAGIFYILIAGLTIAVITAGIEFVYKSLVDSKKSQTPFGSILRSQARLSFRGSLDGSTSENHTPKRKSVTYKAPLQLPGYDPYPDVNHSSENNTHTQV